MDAENLRMNRASFSLGLLTTPLPAMRRGGFADVERDFGCRVGVYAHDLHSGRRAAYHADDVFLLCSTFKLALVMAVLARVDRGSENPRRMVPFGPADIMAHSPALERFPHGGALSIDALLDAIVTRSDNGAANLLLRAVGGPREVTQFVHGLGIARFRLDRYEPQLNVAAPGDTRDTASPRAMVALASRIVRDPVLGPASNTRLSGWLRASVTGAGRIRSATPRSFIAGDKTGTGDHNANDVAILWRRDGNAPIVVAVYVAGLSETAPFDRTVATAARQALQELGIVSAQAS